MTTQQQHRGERITLDGNEAVARVAYRLSEVIALYPITPATPMGDWADRWAAASRPNLWGTVPAVVAMQSEAGVAGAVHGALQAGSLATTFTSSQGLLLMLPNLYKWAGELLPVVVHVATRALATQALSIFGDHSDAMACRSSGCAILCASSVQEAGDLAAIASRASLQGRLPVLHLLDGFRTSHELQTVQAIPDAVLAAMVPPQAVAAHRRRALSPDHPVIRGTAQNPDVAFQARETVNPFVAAFPTVLEEAMGRFGALTGRQLQPYQCHGAANAERLLVLMGSAAETAQETVRLLQVRGEAVAVVVVRLFRPFAAERFCQAVPASVRAIAVLDRCKEPGAMGEPLYLEVVAALAEAWSTVHGDRPLPRVWGGRYGLASKEFTPAMVQAVFQHLGQPEPRNHFTVGIHDDVGHSSLALEPGWTIEPPDQGRAVMVGLGSDGSVGAARSTVQIIGASTDLYAQGYVVVDSKKAGSVTVSHLRFGPQPIRAPYLVQRPTLVACHHWEFLERLDLLAGIENGAALLLNSPWPPAQTWARLPADVRRTIRERQLRLWVIEASRLAREAGLGPRINTVMQVCFFAISGVLPLPQALESIRSAIRKRYGAKGEAVVAANLRAVEASLAQLQPIDWRALDPQQEQEQAGDTAAAADPLAAAPPFVQQVIGPLLQHRGDSLPVSALPCDGTWPSGTARWERRNIAEEVPVWTPDLCVQCNQCVLVCPHAAIRAKVVEPAALAAAPPDFLHRPARDPAFHGMAYTLQVAVEDCTGCGLCVAVCPARDRQDPTQLALTMAPQRPLREQGRRQWELFLALPELPRERLQPRRLNQQPLQQPLFEFSGACAGCGETPYLKLASQLFGDRMLVANATGCSSIYGGNLPTTPWSSNAEGRGPAWCNSLFEDNAEFGYGLRLAVDQQQLEARRLLSQLVAGPQPAPWLPQPLVQELLAAEQTSEAAIAEQRQRVQQLKPLLQQALEGLEPETAAASPEGRLLELADALVKRSIWLVGGDGWAYDIGFGGLDHVLASGRDVNVLVLDTEVYSNTGGQMSKATPLGAVARFAAAGKATPKKDLGLMAMTYGQVYVASVALGARSEHTIRAFLEAESYPGPSLILAYSPCIAHGIAMARGLEQQSLAVASGRWLLYRHDPRRLEQGLPPLQLDMPAPHRPLAEAMASEPRFAQLADQDPERAQTLAKQAQAVCDQRWRLYRTLAGC